VDDTEVSVGNGAAGASCKGDGASGGEESEKDGLERTWDHDNFLLDVKSNVDSILP
jgi:hypothetical protein